MNMIKVTTDDPNWLQLAFETLDTGGIVLHPTSTAYGLAVDALNEEAIERLNNSCNRFDKPYIVLVKNLKDAKRYTVIDQKAAKLTQAHWPGPLTIIVKKNELIPEITTAGLDAVAIRQDSHEVTISLSQAYPRPYTSTSANIAGGPTPYTIQEALDQFEEGDIDLVIDAGELPRVPASTLVDCTKDELEVVRQGSIII